MKSYRYEPDLTLKEKFCNSPDCQKMLLIECFAITKTNKDGYANQCKSCRSKVEAKRYSEKSKLIKNNKDKIQKSRKIYQKEKLKIDPLFKLIRNLRNRTWYALKNKNWTKTSKFNEYIGCTPEELIKYIENQWSEGMNWNNYGSFWELDHINPLSLAVDEEDLNKRSHYTNLKPLKVEENRKKSNKIQNFNEYYIVDITYEMYKEIMQEVHYLDSVPGAKYYFGMFHNQELVGACAYGIPSMPKIANSFVKEEMEPFVLELKRFALKNNLPNEASFFLSQTLKKLPSGHFIITYADPSQDHDGTIYKACNFIEKGLTQKKKNYLIEGKEGLHPRSLEKYTDKTTEYVDRVQKLRYIYITGNGRTKRRLLQFIK